MKFTMLRKKPIIMVSDGSFKGYIKDVEIDVQSGGLIHYVVSTSTFKFLPFLFKKDIILTTEDIVYCGNDVILVKDTINIRNSLVNES